MDKGTRMKGMLWLSVLAAILIPVSVLGERAWEIGPDGSGYDGSSRSAAHGGRSVSERYPDHDTYRPYDPRASVEDRADPLVDWGDPGSPWSAGMGDRTDAIDLGGPGRGGGETYRFRGGATWPPAPVGVPRSDGRDWAEGGHGYHFRNGPSSSSRDWAVSGSGRAYRFRPLTEQEKARIEEASRWRPSDPAGSGYRRPGGGDVMTAPGLDYGFEPPWTRR